MTTYSWVVGVVFASVSGYAWVSGQRLLCLGLGLGSVKRHSVVFVRRLIPDRPLSACFSLGEDRANMSGTRPRYRSCHQA